MKQFDLQGNEYDVQIKDMIEPIPNWEYTYVYEGSRTCGKSYIQSLIDEKDKEIEKLNKELQDTKEHLGEYLYEEEEENKRLNNIINELEKSWKEEITRLNNFIQEDSSMIEINNIRKMLIQEREKDLYKLQELKGDE